MATKKTSTISNKTEEVTAVSKPVKRTKSVADKRLSTGAKSTSPKSVAPKKSTHRHSKPTSPLATAVSNSSVVNYEEVAKLAYHYWEERHFTDGFADDDWHRAEQAIQARQ